VTPGADRLRQGLENLAALAQRVATEHGEIITTIADRYAGALRAGGTLFFAGNGGSAADAQHLATEYVVRYQTTRPALRAVALTTDTSLLTACANDMGFDEVFARQVEALARPGDVRRRWRDSHARTPVGKPGYSPSAPVCEHRGSTPTLYRAA